MGVSGEVRLILDSGLWRDADQADIAAYVRRRADPAAAPRALFDQAGYLAAHPEAAGSGKSPLVHYLTRGAAADLAPHPLFDPAYYRACNAAELGAVSPLAHFVHAGAWRGRDPHRLFDLAHYLGQGPDLAADEDPVSHYVRQGWRDGLSPHPLFDAAWYRRQTPQGSGETAPLVHYVTVGWRMGLSPHPLFDARWYLEQYEDIAAAGFEPLSHYLGGGAAEGRNPSPWFDTAHYVAVRGEALDAAVNPLVDYLAGGAWAVGEARPGLSDGGLSGAKPGAGQAGHDPARTLGAESGEDLGPEQGLGGGQRRLQAELRELTPDLRIVGRHRVEGAETPEVVVVRQPLGRRLDAGHGRHQVGECRLVAGEQGVVAADVGDLARQDLDAGHLRHAPLGVEPPLGPARRVQDQLAPRPAGVARPRAANWAAASSHSRSQAGDRRGMARARRNAAWRR